MTSVREVERIAFAIAYTELAAFKDTYGGPEGQVLLESYLLRPRDVASDTVLLFMHPIGGGAYLPMVRALARAGHHVIYCNSRYRGADFALIMEKVVLDLGAAVKDARSRFGYRNVVLGGWSGGGPLSLYYQEQAEHPTDTATPAGDPPDLTQAGLEPADGMLLVATHPSRQLVLTESLDPSILDESDPGTRDVELDLYDPANPHQPPYTADYLARYRAAQIDRNRRITAWVQEQLAARRAAGTPQLELGFVGHGTMADPRWLDPSIDPNGRTPGTSYLGDPELVNMGPVGLARFSTLRSWLSQWGIDTARADGLRAAGNIGIPAMVIFNGADEVCIPEHARALYDALPGPKELVEIPGANHYYTGPEQRDKVNGAVDRCTAWLADHGWAGNAS